MSIKSAKCLAEWWIYDLMLLQYLDQVYIGNPYIAWVINDVTDSVITPPPSECNYTGWDCSFVSGQAGLTLWEVRDKLVTNICEQRAKLLTNPGGGLDHPTSGHYLVPENPHVPDPHTQVGARTSNLKVLPIAGRQLDPDCDIATVCIFQGHPQSVCILF